MNDLTLRLIRRDDLPGLGAYLRPDHGFENPATIELSIEGLMAPEWMADDGATVYLDREERIRAFIVTTMHEFGHALEALLGLPDNEAAIEEACEAWESRAAQPETDDA